MVEIEINGKKVEAESGSMIIEVADEHSVRIPRFCYHKKLSVAANCRMCLVEVGDARKPMPACATPISQGMKVFTRSKLALDAQRAVMEFLLINHPLDCPVCDQAGECELQDVSMGYGRDISRFHLGKRSVADQNIGPLIETEMTRCIHCTRCVRFGKEIAGLHELGVMNRGEHLEISTLVERTVASELSGNMIDLCPVGALTSKPYRFTARAFELSQRPTIAAHDNVGSHLYAHVIHNEIKRVVPRECESLNETWISDRDRFSYEGLYHQDRVLNPKIKRDGKWIETDWQTALQFAADLLQTNNEKFNVDTLGALVSPNATCEEQYLLQKLVRGLGSPNIDSRVQQQDFIDQEQFALYPHSGITLDQVAKMDTIFLVGSHIRKEQPIIAHRIRMATRNHAQVLVLNPVDYAFHFPVASKHIVAGGDLLQGLASVAKALLTLHTEIKPNAEIAAFLADVKIDDAALMQAKILSATKQGVLWLGALALNHPQAAAIRGLADFIAEHTHLTLGLLTSGANTAGAYAMGALPHRLPGGKQVENFGLNAQAMLNGSLKAFILLGLEAEYDFADSGRALTAITQASVISLNAYQTPLMLQYAQVILPTTPCFEMAGSFINAQGERQAFSACTTPQGQSRPAWKILRVLANLLDVDGFEYQTLEDVQQEIAMLNLDVASEQHFAFAKPLTTMPRGLVRIAPVPMYAQDALVRRAAALQQTPDAQFTGVHINSSQARALGLLHLDSVNVSQNGQTLHLPLVLDETVPEHAVILASSVAQTLGLGAAYQSVELSARSS